LEGGEVTKENSDGGRGEKMESSLYNLTGTSEKDHYPGRTLKRGVEKPGSGEFGSCFQR